MEKKKIINLEILEDSNETGVEKISLVESPAITISFLALKEHKFVEPTPSETEDEFIGRCMSVLVGEEGKPNDPSYAICKSKWDNKSLGKEDLAVGDKISFDYDGTLSTSKGKELAKKEIESGSTVYIISARSNADGMYETADNLNIPHNRVFATGSNKEKIQKIKELGIVKHYDNNQDVINELGPIGEKFSNPYEFLNDENILETVIAMANEFGIPFEDVKVIEDPIELASISSIERKTRNETDFVPSSSIKKGENEFLYKYSGEITDNSRNFCRAFIRMNRLYSFDEVQAMSDVALNLGMGPEGSNFYSIADFKGGVNCKHVWNLYRVYRRENNSLEVSLVGPASGLMGDRPYDMPNHASLQFSKRVFTSEDQRIIVSPVMIPDMEIVRIDEMSGSPYWIKFSKETIAKMSEKFLRDQSTWSTNIEHTDREAGTYIFESWIVETPQDKANIKYGFNAPIGTWFVKMRVTDDKIWEMVRKKKLTGLSLEGQFIDGFEKEEIEKGNILDRIQRILK